MKKTSITKILPAVLAAGMLLSVGTPVLAGEEEEAPKLVQAIPVTKVGNSGETLCGIRIEFSEEVPAANVHSTALGDTFTPRIDRDVDYCYISDTGDWGDVAAESGKYCFIAFADGPSESQSYFSDVTFNEMEKHRYPIQFFVGQNEPIDTVSGNTIASGATICSSRFGEIRLGIDDFTEIVWTDAETGVELYAYLYIPEGWEEASLPMVVHFPAGDREYTEYNGGYRGALFTHQDAVVWASDNVQKDNPSFVLTIGEPETGTVDSDIYLRLVDEISEQYGVDTDRLYAVAPASGAALMFPAVINNPDKFAAMIQVSDNVYHEFETEEEAEEGFKQMTDACPTWFFAASDYNDGQVQQLALNMQQKGVNVNITVGDEMWNGILRGDEAASQAEEQLTRASANGADDLVTIFRANTVKGVGHWCWNESLTNPAVQQWLFAQSR